jgi:hypothetical protein
MERLPVTKEVSLITRIAYCLVLLGAVLPIGLAKSGWVALATGGSFVQTIPYVGPILFLVVGLYRIFVVMRSSRTLDYPSASGFIAFLRNAGVFLLYFGAICAILNWVSGPLMHTFLRSRTESGAEFFMVGVYLAVLGQVGVFGLFLFELGRLRSFEQQAAGGV